jgi:mono/diheme cytochrome c family protein
MKKAIYSSAIIFCISVFIILLYTPGLRGQETGKSSPDLRDDVKKIVLVSCVPCHTDKGGLMSKSKLNFTNWTQYSSAKQKEKADLISSMLGKDKMPPKAAREKRPDIIPTKEQIEIIKKWAESLKAK